MDALLVPTGVVALAEIGDKTQLLAFVLAARFKKTWPIVLGILVATVVNHGLAGALGVLAAKFIGPEILRWVLGLSFIAMAAWVLVPDKIDADEAGAASNHGVFVATAVSFFLAEMGDKTQLATVAMAAHYGAPLLVVIGTTLGMLIADVPAVFVGDKLGGKLPVRAIHVAAALVFAALGVATLIGVGKGVGF
ncbi:MAG: TMEM165/GDT1 family protein [Azoarcus sp.]|jgi:putative Ca2+/H+ antiporter (TMEM165/GDT1 family)|nr:TMEM165/GDT1 family protein [Azoarcus sp.]